MDAVSEDVEKADTTRDRNAPEGVDFDAESVRTRADGVRAKAVGMWDELLGMWERAYEMRESMRVDVRRASGAWDKALETFSAAMAIVGTSRDVCADLRRRDETPETHATLKDLLKARGELDDMAGDLERAQRMWDEAGVALRTAHEMWSGADKVREGVDEVWGVLIGKAETRETAGGRKTRDEETADALCGLNEAMEALDGARSAMGATLKVLSVAVEVSSVALEMRDKAMLEMDKAIKPPIKALEALERAQRPKKAEEARGAEATLLYKGPTQSGDELGALIACNKAEQ